MLVIIYSSLDVHLSINSAIVFDSIFPFPLPLFELFPFAAIKREIEMVGKMEIEMGKRMKMGRGGDGDH
jgi:hypothetical protein